MNVRPNYKLIAAMLSNSEAPAFTFASIEEQIKLLVENDWRRIDDTAPRDGTFILARTDSGYRVIVQWKHHGGWWSNLETQWINLVDWRPLP